MRAHIAVPGTFALAVLLYSCTAWLGWEGTLCDPDGTCGGGLVCDPATRRCLSQLPDAGTSYDAGTIDAGTVDAGAPDSGEADAGGADAGEPDAGELDAGETDAGEPVPGPPTNQCRNMPGQWCRAQLPALSISSPDFMTVWGSSESEVWVGGEQTLLRWNGVDWEDRTSQLPDDAVDVRAISGDEVYLALATEPGHRLYWGYPNADDWVAFPAGSDWPVNDLFVGRSGPGNWTAVYAGESGKYFFCITDCAPLQHPVSSESLVAVHFRLGPEPSDPEAYPETEIWLAGAGGSLLLGHDTEAPTVVATGLAPGGLHAVRAFDDRVIVGGEGHISECAIKRAGSLTSLEDCAGFNLAGGATVRGLWSSSLSDVWAVASDGTVLYRNAAGSWSAEAVCSGTELMAIWGTANVLVVVGADGTIFSKSR